MKTSNKFLLALMLTLPALLIVHHLLLGVQFRQGHMTPNYALEGDEPVRVELQPFRHVRYNGALVTVTLRRKNARQSTTNTQYLALEIDGKPGYYLVKHPHQAQALQYRYHGDTLIIDYKERDGRVNWNSTNTGTLLHAPSLSSLQAVTANIRAETIAQQEPLTVTGGPDVTVTLLNAALPKLDLRLAGICELSLKGGTIDTLQYALLGKARLRLDNVKYLGEVEKVAADTLSAVEIAGPGTSPITSLIQLAGSQTKATKSVQ
ncbi:hypothetical protein ACWKWU_21300 [Chitinophaga lutea]